VRAVASDAPTDLHRYTLAAQVHWERLFGQLGDELR
jgi:hypothetical protein